jgi:HTH-type transcriptional regulator/antitoxin MqsA
MTRGKTALAAGRRQDLPLFAAGLVSLSDPDDMEGQLVDADNQVAEMARCTAKALARGETAFVAAVIRAIRQRCGLTQREAGVLFGTGEKSFEKYESGEIVPSGPTQRLLRRAVEPPELFSVPADRQPAAPSAQDAKLVQEALSAIQFDRIYEQQFAAV